MNPKNDGCATPVNKRTRSLGLRRNASMTCGAAINYKIRSKKQATKPALNETEAATLTPVRSAPERLTASTNCRPYRLALSKTMRDKLTKKRLEFHLANDATKTESGAADCRVEGDEHAAASHTTSNGFVELAEAAKDCNEDKPPKEPQKQKQLDEEQRHKAKVKQLRSDIEMWKTAFTSALDELHQTQPCEPKLDKAALLQQLQVPLQMLRYVDDD